MSYIKIFLIAIYALVVASITLILSPFDYKGKITFFFTKFFSTVILFIAGVKLIVEGKEYIDKGESYIYIMNHQSFFDIPLLMKASPSNIRFIYKKSITHIPIFGWSIRATGYIPINRTDARQALVTLKKAAKRLVGGISIVIFPEGTRSIDGKLGEFKRGAFVIADEAKAKIIPCSIVDSYKILSKEKLEILGGTVKVVFHEPLDYKKDKGFLQEIKQTIQSSLPNN